MDDGPPAGCIAVFFLAVLVVLLYAAFFMVLLQWLAGTGPFVRGTV